MPFTAPSLSRVEEARIGVYCFIADHHPLLSMNRVLTSIATLYVSLLNSTYVRVNDYEKSGVPHLSDILLRLHQTVRKKVALQLTHTQLPNVKCPIKCSMD